MNLRDVASIAGKPGLYKILKPTRSGVIVETVSEAKKKMVVNASQRISVLKEISIYVTGQSEESVPLEEIFSIIKEKHGDNIKIDVSKDSELESFLEGVLPNYDTDRVYNSDIKKLVNWYNLIAANYPEALEAVETEDEAEEEEKDAE
ncbi:DUF5606 domain-containing protein [Limibacter armeniacum]|uniref:DUF5606 family protein n=1 Tax=Limibacter armeniacum TaxID=466084 RepID=UPI002FE5D4B8